MVDVGLELRANVLVIGDLAFHHERREVIPLAIAIG
jgi:hypothetical protein